MSRGVFFHDLFRSSCKFYWAKDNRLESVGLTDYEFAALQSAESTAHEEHMLEHILSSPPTYEDPRKEESELFPTQKSNQIIFALEVGTEMTVSLDTLATFISIGQQFPDAKIEVVAIDSTNIMIVYEGEQPSEDAIKSAISGSTEDDNNG